MDTTISDTMVLLASKDKESSREKRVLRRRCTSLNKPSDTSMFDVSEKDVLILDVTLKLKIYGAYNRKSP